MNHEPNIDPAHQPRHLAPNDTAAEQRPSEQTGTAYVEHIAEQAPTPEAANAVRSGFAEHGTAFAIYLALDGVDRYADSIVDDFTGSYLGRYPDRASLVENTIASFRWDHDLDRLLAGDPLLRAMVTFDRDAIFDFVSEHYQIVELDGGVHVHVFERWP